jgi:hypothetical protein
MIKEIHVFQPYTPGSARDQYGYETVWREPRDEDKD